MKLKLDENLGNAAKIVLHEAGHDVSTVPIQRLQEAPDDELILECKKEGRALITLDLDFANPLRFRPTEYSGIAVLRLPAKPSAQALNDLLRTLTTLSRGSS